MEDKIPMSLRENHNWIVWKIAQRTPDDRPTKLPFSIDGSMAKSNDPTTWSTYAKACTALKGSTYDGLGYMFSADDPFCGIDLDGCRDPDTGKVADWAKEIIREFNTYSEVSPSQTGVKMFCRAKLLAETGRKKELDFEKTTDKQPAIEIYDKLRYFAVTGQRLGGVSPDVEERDAEVKATCERFWPQANSTQARFYEPEAVIERGRKYVSRIPPAISGQSGHNITFTAACSLVIGFGLERGTALALLSEWNQTCQPPWSDRELNHKIDQAMKQPGERNYLRNVQPARWGAVQLPAYEAPQEKPRPQATTMSGAMIKFVESMVAGHGELFSTGIEELDYAIGGGLAKGELIVVAGRPSHGKSVIGIQCAHHWTEAMFPTLIITEEMSNLSIGRRALLYTSDSPEEYWKMEPESVMAEIEEYRSRRAECYIVESCQTMEVAKEEIERHSTEFGVRHVIVDYAQLLQSKGKARWEQMANTSESLRRLVSATHINVLALVQMNQEIEKRTKFEPKMSDLGDCICGDSVVMDADSGKRLTIKEVVDNRMSPRLWSMNTDGKIVKSRVSKSWRAGVKTVYEVTMRSGRRIRCSNRQKFYTEDGWRELRDIKLGSLLAVPRVLKSGFSESMTDDKAILLGMIIGDGNCTGTPELTVTNEDVECAMSLGKRVWPALNPYHKPEARSKAVRRIRYTTGRLCGAGKNPFTSWLRKIGTWGKSGVYKRVPDIIFSSGDSNIAAFLRGLFHADGCVTAGQRVRFTTISEGLARDVQHLLSRIGIHSTLNSARHDGRPYGGSNKLIWNVAIGTKSRIKRFMDVVGFLNIKHSRAVDSLERCLSSSKIGSRDTDKLPASACAEARRLGWKPRRNDRLERICRTTAKQLADAHSDSRLRSHVESEVYWDELADVSRVGREMTYDLTVEGTANYTVNDIITHNTGQSARDADVILFVVWPHRIDHNLPANEYKIYVAKNRNRAINQSVVTCRFEPSRQRVTEQLFEPSGQPAERNLELGF